MGKAWNHPLVVVFLFGGMNCCCTVLYSVVLVRMLCLLCGFPLFLVASSGLVPHLR